MPLRSFAEAYNNQRHEDEAKITVPLPPKVKSWAWEAMTRPMSMTSSIGVKQKREVSSKSEYTYTLIRSDIDDEAIAQRERPDMPRPELGMRQRSRQFCGTLLQGEQPGDRSEGMLAWVDSDRFQGLSGFVIFINAILIGMETDIHSWLWFYFEQMLLSFFTFELVVRIARHGSQFFKNEEDRVWNVFDFSIVTSGVVDQWLVPLGYKIAAVASGHPSTHKGKMSVAFLLMRMLRLLRVVRLFRLVRIVRPLYELAQGVLEALHGMFWVLVFLVMTLYVVAILCTRLIGNGYMLSEDVHQDQDLKEIISMFTSVEDSMFTLFGALTSWNLLKFVPLFGSMPVLKPMFVIFYVYSAWALLAVMTGVVSENMIAIREQMVKEDEAREELRRTMIAKTLNELFLAVDEDKSGTISRQEFEHLINSPVLVRKIERNSHLKMQDLQDLFEWLDRDCSGNISHEEFMKGFTRINEPLRAKTLMNVQERLNQDIRRMANRISQTLENRVAEVESLVTAPLRKVHAITEQMQTLDVHFTGMRGSTIHDDVGMPTREEIREVEIRLSEKLSRLLTRLGEVERAAEGQAYAQFRTGN